MGRTNAKKEEARSERLKGLPRSERLAKSALIKRREGRVLNASEKHAMKMTSEYGELMKLWEILRVLSGPSAEPVDDDDNNNNNKTKNDLNGGSGGGGAEAVVQSVKEIKGSRYEYKYPTVDKLLKIIEPKFDSYIKTPRVSRVIQSMIKYGSPKQLERITKLFSVNFAAHATDAHGHFAVTALIRHAPHTLLDRILALIIPAVPSLISHRFGIEVLHAAYSSRLCTLANRNLLVLAIFKDNVAVMKRWRGYPVLEDVLQQETGQRKRLLSRLFDLCDKLVSQKGAIEFPFVQRLAFAFVRYGTKDEVSELCETLRPYMATLCTTREGAPLTSLSFSLIEPKKRKEVLRAFTDNLGALATGKYSAPVIARLFDLVYDPQLLRKYVLHDLEAHISQVVNSPFGHQILLHLLTPSTERKQRFLLPNWFEHNLYSVENNSWNMHTWLTHEYVEETVELCPKSAVSIHLAALPSIIRRFMTVVSDPAAKLNRHYVGLISREVLHVRTTDAAYKQALGLSTEEVQLLRRLAPAGEKHIRENDPDDELDTTTTTTTAPSSSLEKPKLKRRRTEKEAKPSKKTLTTAGNSAAKPVKKESNPQKRKTKLRPKQK